MFASGCYTFKQFSQWCYPKECKSAILHLKHRGYKKAIRAAQLALKLRGFVNYKEDMRDLCK